MYMSLQVATPGGSGDSKVRHVSLLAFIASFGRGTKGWYSLIEQQVSAVHQALLATEAFTGPTKT